MLWLYYSFHRIFIACQVIGARRNAAASHRLKRSNKIRPSLFIRLETRYNSRVNFELQTHGLIFCLSASPFFFSNLRRKLLRFEYFSYKMLQAFGS